MPIVDKKKTHLAVFEKISSEKDDNVLLVNMPYLDNRVLLVRPLNLFILYYLKEKLLYALYIKNV